MLVHKARKASNNVVDIRWQLNFTQVNLCQRRHCRHTQQDYCGDRTKLEHSWLIQTYDVHVFPDKAILLKLSVSTDRSTGTVLWHTRAMKTLFQRILK